MIRYNETTQQITEREFELAQNVTVTFALNGGRDTIAVETKRVERVGDEPPKLRTGRIISQEVPPAARNIDFPILNPDGTPSGQTMNLGTYLDATESLFIALATREDS